jgi:hypothetical protein
MFSRNKPVSAVIVILGNALTIQDVRDLDHDMAAAVISSNIWLADWPRILSTSS